MPQSPNIFYLQIRQQDFRQHPMASLGQVYSIHRHAPGAVLFCRGIKTLLHGNAGKADSRKISLHLRSPGAKQLTKRFSRGRQVSSSSGTEKRNGSTTTIRWQPEVISPRSSEQNASEASASMEAAAVSVLPCAIISPMSLMPPSRKTVLKHCPFQVRCISARCGRA